MNSTEISRELAAFDEKIQLSMLEEAKATERTRELQYQKSRFQLDVMVAVCKQQTMVVPPQEQPATEKKQ